MEIHLQCGSQKKNEKQVKRYTKDIKQKKTITIQYTATPTNSFFFWDPEPPWKQVKNRENGMVSQKT